MSSLDFIERVPAQGKVYDYRSQELKPFAFGYQYGIAMGNNLEILISEQTYNQLKPAMLWARNVERKRIKQNFKARG